MKEQHIQDIIKKISSTIQCIKIYTLEHPRSIRSIDETFALIKEFFSAYGDVEIGLADQEFFSGKEVFFQLSQRLPDLIEIFKKTGIEKLNIRKSLRKEELYLFFKTLLACRDGELFVDAGRRLSIKPISLEVGVLGGQVCASGDVEESEAPVEKTGKNHDYDVFSLCQRLIETNSATAEFVTSGRAIEAETVYAFSCDAYRMITENRNTLFNMLSLKHHDDYTFVHSLNVALLSMYQAGYLGLEEELVKRMGMAGLFHDIGKHEIKTQLLNKKDKLTDDEFEIIKSHTMLGAEEIFRQGLDDPFFLIGAHQHHIGIDLNKYPRPVFMREQSMAAQIIAVADVYDALRSRRSYKKPMALEKVYEIMQKEKGTLLNPKLVDLLFENIGIWPIGTIVRLNTAEVAIVRGNNKKDIFSPEIDIRYDNEGMRLSEPVRVNLAEQTASGEYLRRVECYIDPEDEEGRKYVREIFQE